MAALVLLAYGSLRSDENTVGALLVLPLAGAAAAWMSIRLGRGEDRFDVTGIALTGFALRLCGLYLRFLGASDAREYHAEGTRIAASLRSFDLFVETGREVPGTGVLRYLSGIVHVFTLDDMSAAFVVFTLAAFGGACLLYRAFTTGLPDGDHRRYALLVFLWPSLLYWPSSLGKEAWMMLGLGIASLGVARVLTGRPASGYPLTVLGLTALGMVRPHVALIVLCALLVGLLLRPSQGSVYRTAGKIFGILVLLVGGAVLARTAATNLGIDNLGTASLDEALNQTTEQTTTGSSSFTPPTVDTPLDYPWAFVTVLFRPFPQEVDSTTGALAVLESIALLALLGSSWRRVAKLVDVLKRDPYVTYAIAYVLSCTFAFSSIGNFGILTRQRIQVLPFVFVLLALPMVPRPTGRRDRLATGSRRRRTTVGSRHARRRESDVPAGPPEDVGSPGRVSPRARRRTTAVAPPATGSTR